MAKNSDNREAWLQSAIKELRPLFTKNGHKFKQVHVSVGWPGGRGNHSSTIAQAWESQVSSDKKNHIFISPVINDTYQVLSALTHELCHVVNDWQDAHNKPFISIAKSVGLLAPWTATKASDELTAYFDTVVGNIGKYKSPKIIIASADRQKKQPTRMIKVTCPDCGYIVRTTQKWIDFALPRCGHCDIEMEQQ